MERYFLAVKSILMLSKITDMKMCSVSPTTKLVVRCQLHYTCTSICIVTCKNIINWLMINSLAVYFYFVVFCFLLSEFSLDENAFLGRLFVFTFRNIWKTLSGEFKMSSGIRTLMNTKIFFDMSALPFLCIFRPDSPHTLTS